MNPLPSYSTADLSYSSSDCRQRVSFPSKIIWSVLPVRMGQGSRILPSSWTYQNESFQRYCPTEITGVKSVMDRLALLTCSGSRGCMAGPRLCPLVYRCISVNLGHMWALREGQGEEPWVRASWRPPNHTGRKHVQTLGWWLIITGFVSVLVLVSIAQIGILFSSSECQP